MNMDLGAKFMLSVLLVLSCTLAVWTFHAIDNSTQAREQRLNERGRALGRLMALFSPHAILASDYGELHEYTRGLCSEPDIAYGAVVSPLGTPLSACINDFDATRRHAVQPASTNTTSSTIEQWTTRNELLHLEFPIAQNGVLLGKFLVGISRHAPQKDLRRQLAMEITSFVATIVLLYAAIYGVFRLNVLQPIQRLIAVARAEKAGRHAVGTEQSGDEWTVLESAFKAMAKEIEREKAKVQRQTHFDALTGLPNRSMGLERIAAEIRRAESFDRTFAVLVIDLDNFKAVNDGLGHAAGDQLLVAVGARVRACLRHADSAARLGGDEFLVVVPDVSTRADIKTVADRLLQAVSKPQTMEGRRVVLKCSIGIAVYPENGQTSGALMANVDAALYQAKTSGTSAALFFDEKMNMRVRERMQIEHDLTIAADLGQLSLHFQPIVDTACQRPLGAEVLLRWQHPEKGFISPADFIPIAEAGGQIRQIGDWVLAEACRCWSEWNRAGIAPGYLAINISGVQFTRGFSEQLGRVMSACGMPPEALELEVTERVLLCDHDLIAEELRRLRTLGVRLSLDDFGTGYSALGYLKRFQFDLLKVDQSFVAGLPFNSGDISLVKAILAMAAGLNLKVVAEGVENQEQLRFLRKHGCDFAQGYLFSKPLDKASYHAYLERHRHGRELVRLAVPG
jgi:diguanylate cyclase